MKTAKTVIPKRLSAPARAWVQGVISAFDLEPHHYRLLLNAADFWDEGELATTILRREGVTVLSAAGTAKAHPALAIARSSFRVARRSVAPCKSFAGQAVTTLAQPPPPSILWGGAVGSGGTGSLPPDLPPKLSGQMCPLG